MYQDIVKKSSDPYQVLNTTSDETQNISKDETLFI